ncbi:dipicolinic acid synthetase subunit A [Thalassorhabdus alkalitolerans]|uniref:Dipicolinic acid synthetase subunit A n=1 Tax=Thalassorhabdus alkalitolerans TaxID=2282697 RepID=A0ABW0YL36_9BACI|nr:dipicolinic acid synthetase subunit A [Thalassobacillus sp. C254]
MLTGKKIAVIGGDARQIEVIDRLIQRDATLFLVGFEKLQRQFIGAKHVTMEEILGEDLHAVLLPVSGMQENGEVETTFSSKPAVVTQEWLNRTPKDCSIYTGISNKTLDEMAKKAECSLIKLLERDDVAIYNAIPTAEGTLLLVIQDTDITVHGSETIILGLGRVGMTVARTFSALGAYVKVGTDNSAERARAEEMKMKAFPLKELPEKVQSADICINTIPAPVLTGHVLAHMAPRCIIVDLASKPGGTDFTYAKKRGIRAKLAPGLPGLVAPKTAGRILADVAVRLLEEQ